VREEKQATKKRRRGRRQVEEDYGLALSKSSGRKGIWKKKIYLAKTESKNRELEPTNEKGRQRQQRSIR
jgi:hypothetical protein